MRVARLLELDSMAVILLFISLASTDVTANFVYSSSIFLYEAFNE